MTSPEAFAILANDDEAQPHIDRIHDKLLGDNIWVWKMGDIDHHLGIEGKTESNWSLFKRQVSESTFSEVAVDSVGVHDMFEWMRN